MKVICIQKLPPAMTIVTLGRKSAAGNTSEGGEVASVEHLPPYIEGKSYRVYGLLFGKTGDLHYVLTPEPFDVDDSSRWLALGPSRSFRVEDGLIDSGWRLSDHFFGVYSVSICRADWGDLLDFISRLSAGDEACKRQFLDVRNQE